MFGTVRSGSSPALAKPASHRGRRSTSGANRIIVSRSSRSGMAGLPQSLACENVQSSVRISPTAPAARARSMWGSICSRVPIQ